MDPNATLKAFRDALAEAANATEYTDEREDALLNAAEHAAALDEWLTGGGFLPKAWAR